MKDYNIALTRAQFSNLIFENSALFVVNPDVPIGPKLFISNVNCLTKMILKNGSGVEFTFYCDLTYIKSTSRFKVVLTRTNFDTFTGKATNTSEEETSTINATM